MTLKITLKPGERVLIGGACVEVVSRTVATILIDGDEPVLRHEYAIYPSEVIDLPTRIRNVLQKMYLSGDILAHHDEYFALARQLLNEQPEAQDWIGQTNKHLLGGDIYLAVKAAKLGVLEQRAREEEEDDRAFARAS